MTRNQIMYMQARMQDRAARATEAIRSSELSETQRANRAREAQNIIALGETARSHLATESLTRAAQQESARHNVQTETQAQAELAERRRHQQATEDETHRHNLTGEVTEGAKLAQLTLHQANDTALRRDTLEHTKAQDALELAERVRHNLAMEVKPAAQIQVAGSQATATGGAVEQQSANTNPVSGLNVRAPAALPPQTARQGGTVFSSDGKYYYKKGDELYVWQNDKALQGIQDFGWKKMGSTQASKILRQEGFESKGRDAGAFGGS